jgi:hypothetical protein
MVNPKNVVYSNILLTGACPAAIHLVTKYPSCAKNPAHARPKLIHPHLFVLLTDLLFS